MELRRKIGFYLDDIETPLGIAIDLIITELVLLSTIIFVIETYPIPATVKASLDTANNGILILFAIEYLLRFWCAEDRGKYFFSPYALIDLMTILPFFIGVVDISYIRIFRWFRILRLIRFLNHQSLFGKVSASDSIIFFRILFSLFAIIFVYSGLIYQVEHQVNPDNFRTFLDAFYFSVVTMTTVGFGDITPTSEAGQLLTVLMILTGIAIIPWQLGDLIRQFVKTGNQVQIQCPKCSLAFHDTDANFCKRCGTWLHPHHPLG